MKRLLTSLLLAVALLVPFTSTAHALQTSNLAGRPIQGSASAWCQGLAYGKVNGKIVLFTAAHCRIGPVGTVINGPTGARIGLWSEVPAGSDHDLAYIVLDSGNWPATLNHVYRGDCGTSCNTYWTVTSKFSTVNVSCSVGQSINAYQNFQSTLSTTTQYRVGTMTGWASWTDTRHCVVQTTLPIHSGLKDSGSSFFATTYPGNVVGVATNAPGGLIAFSPTYEGITDLNTYWLGTGSHIGAWFCATATC